MSAVISMNSGFSLPTCQCFRAKLAACLTRMFARPNPLNSGETTHLAIRTMRLVYLHTVSLFQANQLIPDAMSENLASSTAALGLLIRNDVANSTYPST